MTTEHLAALFAFAFVSSITPGPNNLMLMASGTNFGVARTLPHALGVTFGFVFMILLVGAGLIKIFELVPYSFLALKIFSVGYLLWLAWKIARSGAPQAKAAAENARPMSFIQAALFQWVNPKAWTMALTGVAAYTLPESPVVSLLIVGLVFGLVNLPSVASWMVLGAQLRRFLGDPVKLRVFNVTAAALLVASLWPVIASSGLHAH